MVRDSKERSSCGLPFDCGAESIEAACWCTHLTSSSLVTDSDQDCLAQSVCREPSRGSLEDHNATCCKRRSERSFEPLVEGISIWRGSDGFTSSIIFAVAIVARMAAATVRTNESEPAYTRYLTHFSIRTSRAHDAKTILAFERELTYGTRAAARPFLWRGRLSLALPYRLTKQFSEVALGTRRRRLSQIKSLDAEPYRTARVRATALRSNMLLP